MNQRLRLLAGSLLLMTGAAQAQVRFRGGPMLGLMVTSARYSLPSYNPTITESRYKTGVAVGVMGSLEKGHVAFQPALQFCQAGYGIYYYNSGGNDLSSVRLNYVKLPLNFAYLLRADGEGLRLFAGGYASLFTGGTLDVSGATRSASLPIVSDDGSLGYHVRAGDVGAQAGIGFLQQPLFVQASYSFGLANVEKGDATAYNRGFQISLSYLFGPSISTPVAKDAFSN